VSPGAAMRLIHRGFDSRSPPRSTGSKDWARFNQSYSHGGWRMFKYKLGNERFETKIQLTNYIVWMRDKYAIGEKLEDYHFSLLMELLQSHPDKSGDDGWFYGIEFIKVDFADYGTRCFYAVYKDGSTSKFSFHKCIKNLSKQIHTTEVE
jgi:hypothetical protein